MKEFKTANNNMGDFTYMPGFSAVAATDETKPPPRPPMAPARLRTSSPTAQTTSVDTLKNFGLSVSE